MITITNYNYNITGVDTLINSHITPMHIHTPSHIKMHTSHTSHAHVTHTGKRISLKDIKDFPLKLWLVFIICVFYYVTVFPFIGLAV